MDNSKPRFSARSTRLLGLVALLAVAGCADKDWGYVTGTVTVDGKPIGPGSIMFEPENPVSVTTPSAIAHFREDGKYELKSAGNKKGAPVGKYLVMIHDRSEEHFGDETIDPNHKSAIPKKYLNHRTSGLTAEIKPGSQVIDFPLTQ